MSAAMDREIFQFGAFKANLVSGQLQKSGLRIKLQAQAFQLLLAFLERPGELITRNDIRHALWPSGLHVDFNHSINNAVNRLRLALEDPARQSRYIENVPRRGYRFVATVERYLHTQIGTDSRRTRRSKPCVPEKARELYLKGRYCWNRRTPDGLARALRFFRAAIKQ